MLNALHRQASVSAIAQTYDSSFHPHNQLDVHVHDKRLRSNEKTSTNNALRK